MLRWTCLLLLLVPLFALAQRPPAVVPDNPDLVLERLPRGYATLAPPVAGFLPANSRQAEQWLAAAVRTGDARLVARAEAVLARIPAGAITPQILRDRAFVAQHRHDFAGALRLLDAVLDKDPRDADARLTRAQIHLVQGRLDRARSDCAALVLGVDASAGTLCVAALALRRGDTATAARLVDRWLAQGLADNESLRYALVMRGETASQAGDPGAEQWFRRALAGAPSDVRTLAAYARHLRDSGRNREVLALLNDVRDNEGLLLQRALAAHALKAPEAKALRDMLARRYALTRALGGEPELRDEAEFELTLHGNPTRALRLALRNFETQRDGTDVELLQRAARAARKPNALRPMQAWARSQQLSIPKHEVRQ